MSEWFRSWSAKSVTLVRIQLLTQYVVVLIEHKQFNLKVMSLDLTKGERLDITKTNPGLTIAAAGLGWDVRAGAGEAFDLDAFAIILESGKLKDMPNHVLYFGSPKSGGKPTIMGSAVVHSGDNLTGAGAGDDETIMIEFSKLPTSVTEILICVNIYQAVSRRQNFGQVNNAFVRIYDFSSKAEICKYDLSEDFSAFNAMIMGKLYLKDGEWKFQAVGEGKNGDINELCVAYQ